MTGQRGGFVLGLVVGLLVGLALALGVALYITKAPVPFVNKVPQRTAEQDQAEQARNKNWDPNAPLAGKPGRSASRRRPRPLHPAPRAATRGGCAPAARRDAAAPPAPASGRPRPGRHPGRWRDAGRRCPRGRHRPHRRTRSSTSCRPAPTPGRRSRTAARQAGPAGPVGQDHRTRTVRARGVPRAPGPGRCTPEADATAVQAAGSRHRGAAGACRAPLSSTGTPRP
jgi:hypothetical protein